MIPGIGHDNALVTAADNLERSIKALFPGDPARAEEFLTAFAQGSGSLASLLLGGVAIRGAATLLAKSGKVASRVGTTVLGSTSQAVEGFEEAERMGADALARYTAFFLNAGLGATEAIPIDRFFSRLNRTTNNRVANLLQTTSAQSLEEFTQEVIESLGADVIAKAVFDPEREIDVRGALKQGAVGAITGGPLGVGAGLTARQRPRIESLEFDSEFDLPDEVIAKFRLDTGIKKRNTLAEATSNIPELNTKPIRGISMRTRFTGKPQGPVKTLDEIYGEDRIRTPFSETRFLDHAEEEILNELDQRISQLGLNETELIDKVVSIVISNENGICDACTSGIPGLSEHEEIGIIRQFSKRYPTLTLRFRAVGGAEAVRGKAMILVIKDGEWIKP